HRRDLGQRFHFGQELKLWSEAEALLLTGLSAAASTSATPAAATAAASRRSRRNARVGAVFHEKLHRVDVHAISRAPERRRAVDRLETAIRVTTVVIREVERHGADPIIRIRAFLEQLFHQLEI